MSKTVAKSDAPKTKYLADYKKPDFLIETVDLDFDLHDSTNVNMLTNVSTP